MDARYVRFVVSALYSPAGESAGLFQVRTHARLRLIVPEVDARVARQFDWFDANLPYPELAREDPRILFWFRADAGETLRRARLLASWLRARGIMIETLSTTDPGRIVYEDRHQVGAIAGAPRAP